MTVFSTNLHTYRRAADLRQKDLAERIGVESSYISLLESGRRDPSTKILIKIADVLNVSLDALMGRGQHRTSVEDRLAVIERRLKQIERKVGTNG